LGLSVITGDFKTACYHHNKLLFDKYDFLHKSCCDPFGIHDKGPVKGSLHKVTLDKAQQLNRSRGWQTKLDGSCAADVIAIKTDGDDHVKERSFQI